MTPKLSICIGCLNEDDISNTVASIRQTSPEADVEIVIIDDCSTKPVVLNEPFKNVKLFRNAYRQGCGATRHQAAGLATAPLLLFVDAHMRFVPGWYDAAMCYMAFFPTTLGCAQCLGLNENNMDVTKPEGAYNGATFRLYDGSIGVAHQIYEGVWAEDKPDEDNYELACVMGACYFIHKEFFFKIGGLNALKMWGSDEPYLSLKVWLAGGDVRMFKSIKIGHKFRSAAPYSTGESYILYNKVRSIMTTIHDADIVQFLVGKFPASKDFKLAMEMIEKDREEIKAEARFNKSIFKHDIHWFMEKFGMKNPVEERTAAPNEGVGPVRIPVQFASFSDPRLASDGHYQMTYKGIRMDPYRICDIYGIVHPAQQHALKKLLRAGRSVKDLNRDIDETIMGLQRWKEMIAEDAA